MFCNFSFFTDLLPKEVDKENFKEKEKKRNLIFQIALVGHSVFSSVAV